MLFLTKHSSKLKNNALHLQKLTQTRLNKEPSMSAIKLTNPISLLRNVGAICPIPLVLASSKPHNSST
jgi:hypothetical protein